MSEISVDIDRVEEPWDVKNEEYLIKIIDECKKNSVLHEKAGYFYKHKSEIFVLPTLIISMILAPMTNIINDNERILNIINTVGFIIIGILTAINKFYNFQKKEILHFNYQQKYNTVKTDIEQTLVKKRKHRIQADLFTQEIILTFDFLNQQAPVIPNSILNQHSST